MNLKTFAQQSRKILLKGVEHKLRYWGFDADGNVSEEPVPVPGGYMIRGEAYDDPAMPGKWRSLKAAIRLKGLDAVMEEAAYTWFNRMMAIRILAKNGYDLPQLEYADDANKVPLILQRARRGTIPFLNPEEKKRLQGVLSDFSKELQAFAMLITGYCHSHPLLLRVFGSLDDYTEILLPDDILSDSGFIHLLNTTDAISDEQYNKVELIGWLYQFYISEKKDEVFKKFKQNKKAEAADIPAATQIFTPNWIVKYMVENTVGKIWLDLHPESPLQQQMKYLVRPPEPQTPNDERQTLNVEHQTPNPEPDLPAVAGTRNPEPGTLNIEPGTLNPELAFTEPAPYKEHTPLITEVSQLKLLDPASGSGHILVEGFDLLFEMYLEEYYSDAEAVESIFKNNLFGLDIDKRAVQLAQFAILLKAAARYPDVLKKDWLPQVYAMPDATDFSWQEIMDFLGSEGLAYQEPLQKALELMKQGQNLGSIMKFELSDATRSFVLIRLQTLQGKANRSFHEQAILQRIKPYISVLLVLTQKYEAIAANPPYMGQKNMNGTLKTYVNTHYPLSKSDLFAVFMEVCLSMNMKSGLMGMINQHSWMFLSSYEKLREKILGQQAITSMMHLGPRTFEELSGEVVQSTAFVLKNDTTNRSGTYYRLLDYRNNTEKKSAFLSQSNFYPNIPQSNFSKIPGSPIAYWVSERIIEIFEANLSLSDFTSPRKGNSTSDNARFLRTWPEVAFDKVGIAYDSVKDFLTEGKRWLPYNKGGGSRKWYGHNENLIDWKDNAAEIRMIPSSVITNEQFYMKPGLTWSTVSSKSFGIRYFENGFIFDNGGCCIFNLKGKRDYFAGLMNSNTFSHILGQLNPTLNFQSGEVSKFPVIFSDRNFEHFSTSCKEISKNDWDSRETSWDFEKSPLLNGCKTLIAAYRQWQQQASNDFFQLHANEEELNRIFIDIYCLQDELTPDVALKDITILQEEMDFKKLEKLEPRFRKSGKDAIELPIKKDEVMRQLISYAMGVFMGRYRFDKPGLHIAHPNPGREELQPYIFNGHNMQIDDDAIIPLMGQAGQFSDDAYHRFRHFLEVVWGADTLVENLNFLQNSLDEDLESYLVKGFWKDHCRRYKKKPIYWLFSSPKGAFQVLVYMHRMNAFTAEKVRGNYLIEHIKFLRGRISRMESNSSSLSAQDARLLDKLRRDLEECELYDQQLKNIADMQDKLVFDLDDGVTENYKLFEGVVREIK